MGHFPLDQSAFSLHKYFLHLFLTLMYIPESVFSLSISLVVSLLAVRFIAYTWIPLGLSSLFDIRLPSFNSKTQVIPPSKGQNKLGLSCAKLMSSWVSWANLREMFNYAQFKLKLLFC